MSTGEATIYLELDKTREIIWAHNNHGEAYRTFELTGWRRYLNLTRSLHKAGADYIVEFELAPALSDFTVNGTVVLCGGQRLKAHIAWVTS